MAKTSVYYTLGVYLAKHLMSRHIPSLSCNQCTNNVVQVTSGEADELKRLEDSWHSKLNDERRNLRDAEMKSWEKDNKAQEASEDEWNELMKYRYILKEKYLPHVIKCHVPDIDFSNEKNNEKIKKGMIETLWDWDFCEWSLDEEDITFENEKDTFGANDKYSMHFSYVTLKLGLEAPSSYTGDEWIEIKTPQKSVS